MQFSARLVAFATSIVLLTVGLSSVLVYARATSDLERSLANELMGITRSTASLIDADLLELVYIDDLGEIVFMDEFLLIREQLDRVRTLNELPADGNPIYIMRPLPDFDATGHLEFVVMPDQDASGRYFVGNVYPSQPHHIEALAGRAASTAVYTDEEGTWISAAAPLRDSRGDVVALLQVDRPVEVFYQRVRSRAYSILWVAAISIFAGILLAIGFSRSLTGPLREIAEGVRAFGSGELSRRVRVERHDEIGELAEGFNEMADRLERDTHKLEEARESAIESLRSKSELVSNMDAINRVLTALAWAESVDHATQITMKSVCECYGWAYACCWRIVPGERALGFAMDWGTIDRAFMDSNRDVTLARGIGLPGRAWANGVVEAADDRPDEHGYQKLTPRARAAGASSGVAIPILRDGELECVLEFVTVEGHSVSVALRETLAGVAQLLAEALDRLHSEADKAAISAENGLVDEVLRTVATAASPEAILEGMARAMRDAFGWSGVVAWRVDGERLRRITGSGDDAAKFQAAPAVAPVDGWLADCVRQKGLVEVDHASKTNARPTGSTVNEVTRCDVLCVPIVRDQDVLGVVEVQHDTAIDLTESRRDSLESVARVAADSAAGLIAAEMRQRAGAVATEIMERVAHGDLVAGMHGSFHGDFESLQHAINTSITNLRTMVSGIRDVAGAVSSGASDIRERNDSLREQTREQSVEIARCSESVSGLGESVRDNADRCDRARSLASTARDLAVQGSTVAGEAAGLMSEVEGTTREISDVIGVIDGIAERTNLLALNASIEAVRAGEAGRGFAIVANEVEELARRCATAAQQVRVLVTRTVDSVRNGADSVRHSGSALDEIVDAVSSANQSIGEIAKTSTAQTESVELVESVMGQLETGTRRYADYMQEVSESIRWMSERATELDRQVDSFKVEGASAPKP